MLTWCFLFTNIALLILPDYLTTEKNERLRHSGVFPLVYRRLPSALAVGPKYLADVYEVGVQGT